MNCLNIKNQFHFPKWRDDRVWDEQDKTNTGKVVDTNTGEIFGAFSGHSDKEIKATAAEYAFWVCPTGLILSACGVVPVSIGLLISIMGAGRAASRIWDMLNGDFIESAKNQAQREWLLQRYRWRTDHIRLAEPTHCRFKKLIIKRVFIEFAKNILKIVTIPLQMLALTFTNLYAVYNPLYGRWLNSKIENLWRRERRVVCPIVDPNTNVNVVHRMFHRKKYRHIISEYAVCMHPKSTLEKDNTFGLLPFATRDCIRSRFLEIVNIINDNHAFWNALLTSSKLTQFMQDIQECRTKGISKMKVRNDQEFSFVKCYHNNIARGSTPPKHTVTIVTIRNTLAEIVQSLQAVMKQYSDEVQFSEKDVADHLSQIESKIILCREAMSKYPSSFSNGQR